MIDIIYHENYFIKGSNFIPYESVEYFEFIKFANMKCVVELPMQNGMSQPSYSDHKMLDLHILRIYTKSGVCFEYHATNLNGHYATAKNWDEFTEWNEKLLEFKHILDHKILKIPISFDNKSEI
mgnify:CR=1 FL=1